MTTKLELVDLPLEPGSVAFINGAVLAMAPDGKLKVAAGARVLTKDKLVTDAAQADTPTKRIYFILQSMLIDSANAGRYRGALMDLVFDRSDVTTLPPVMLSLATLLRLADAGDYQGALEICERLIALDEALVSQYPAPK